jgi:hypothetical protein
LVFLVQALAPVFVGIGVEDLLDLAQPRPSRAGRRFVLAVAALVILLDALTALGNLNNASLMSARVFVGMRGALGDQLVVFAFSVFHRLRP